MHHALQFIRPLLITIEADGGEGVWRRQRASAALVACDSAMIAADEESPNHDFY